MLQPAVKSRTNTPPTGLKPASTSAGRPLTADLRSVWESHSETSAVLLVLHLSVCASCFRATVLWNILLLLVVSMWYILTSVSFQSGVQVDLWPLQLLCSHIALHEDVDQTQKRNVWFVFLLSVPTVNICNQPVSLPSPPAGFQSGCSGLFHS